MLQTRAIDRKMILRFVTPSSIKRRDYDLAIYCGDGTRICAETKCKLEETEITIRTIERSLSDAKRQLPPSAPGIIFVKYPHGWVSDPLFVERMRGLAS